MPSLAPAHPHEAVTVPMRMGFDLVQVSQVEESISTFGDAYKRRIYTEGELRYADEGNGVCAERLAARFAAKEALIKALQPGDEGIDPREIEVVRSGEGACHLALHGRIAALAERQGVTRILLSMSHDGGYAGAVVNLLYT
jgi:holo-[acyl-carrier protein] synthase